MLHVAVGLLFGMVAGCNAKQVHYEQAGARRALMSLYEEQLFSNLIRASEYMPFVHMDYSEVTDAATGQAKVTLETSRTETDNNFATGATAGIARTLQWVVKPVFEGSQQNALTIKGAPANGQYLNDAYMKYLNQFVPRGAFDPATGRSREGPTTTPATRPTVRDAGTPPFGPGDRKPDELPLADGGTDAKILSAPPLRQGEERPKSDPLPIQAPPAGFVRAHLRSDTSKPPKEQIHHGLVRHIGDTWYWVPATSAREFFVLFQATTLVRPAVPTSGSLSTQLELLRLNEINR
jgi:hypothetical protein